MQHIIASGIDPRGPFNAATGRLSKVETWITSTGMGGDGWGRVKPFLFVRLTQSDGLSGWGEAFVLPCRETAVAEIIHALATALTDLEDITPWTMRDHVARIADKHRGLDFSAATSALEMALWDIQGKREDRPLYEMLGGARRKDIPVYANIWSETQWQATDLARRATDLKAQGYTAVKVHPLLNHDLEQAVAAVATVRAAIGPDMHLMVDMDAKGDEASGVAFAGMIAPFAPYWLEEPLDGAAINALAAVSRATPLRVVTGERQFGLPHFEGVLRARAAQILNPDIAGLGGILDMLDLAHMADAQGVAVSPHCWNSMTVAASAMMHVCAAIPNAEMAEIYPEYLAHGARFASVGFRLNGANATVSCAPGLGVDVDVTALQACAAVFKQSDLERRGERV
ncbi:MAG: mandelate racemase/muconate lactonizing enzyme family protein [Pseudomonadota bacterium]